MANYANLKAAISQAIKTNGNQEITGQVLQDVLNSIVSVIGANYTFVGVATPATNPGTPDQNVVYLAMEGGTYTNFNAMVLSAGISLLMWNGTWTSETVMYGDGGVFDISVYKSSGGTLATFADLAAALDGGNNIPSAARKGGMSVKFVQSSDNKYVQYRLMSDTFNTTLSNWQGVDDEPTSGSNNWVKSGGIYNYLAKEIVDQETAPIEKNKLIRNNGDVENVNTYSIVRPIHLQKGDVIKVNDGTEIYIGNNVAALFVCLSDGTWQSTILSGRGGNIAIVYMATTDMYIGFCCGTADATYTVYRLTEAAPNDDFEAIKNTIDGHSDAISTLDSDDKLFISSDIYQKITFESGKIIEVPATGTQGSITPISAGSTWSCGYAECKEGEKIFLNVLGSIGTSSAYGFLDENMIVLQRAVNNARIENQTLTAPQNAAYIVVNTVNTIANCKAYVVPQIKEVLDDVAEKVNNMLVFPSSIKIVRGWWDEYGKGTSYTNYFLCTDRIVYCLAGSYIDNPNGWLVQVRKFAENNPLVGGVLTNFFDTKISISENGWYSFSMRPTDYHFVELSDFPKTNFHCIYDVAHKQEPYMLVNFIGGSTGDYPLGGDNTLFTTPNGKKLAIDFGGEIAVTVCKQQYYKNGGLKLDYIVISHYHNDHIGGLVNGLENGWLNIEGATMFLPDQNAVEYAIENNMLDSTSLDCYNRLQTALQNVSVTKVYPSEEMKPYYIDDNVFLSFFNTNQTYLEGETDDYNNFSLGCYITYGGTRICMTGDMSRFAEEHCSNVMLKADIMKAAHHGFDGAESWLDPAFIRSVYPDIVIAEDAMIHDDRIINPTMSDRFAQLTWCEKNGVPYYRTRQLGVIDVTIFPQNYIIDTHTESWVRNGKNWSYSDNPIPTE